MVGITIKRCVHTFGMLLLFHALAGCVSTEELYAQYDAADCNLVATKDESGAVNLHEQNSDTHFPWEPAVYFEFDSAELSDDELARLSQSMQVLKQFPSLYLGLQGFTDKRGAVGYNLELASRRVSAVKRYVESQGVAGARVILQPIGETISQAGTTTPAVNRRVELMLLDAKGRPLAVQYAMN